MSLQVWLPLTENIENQGLSDLTFSITNSAETTIDNNGKIGKCYSQSSLSGTGGLISNKTINLGQKQSMFCWFKFTDLTSSSSLGGGLVSQHRYPSNQGMGITIRYVSSTTGYLSVNTGNGSSRTYNSYYGTTLLQANIWYHGGYTYDGSTLKIYVNGNCEKTQSITGMSVPADYISCFNWSMSSTSGTGLYSGYKLHGSLNDVRIYDECLSPLEVKRISQGLILHYPLDNNGLGNENLAIKTGERAPDNSSQVEWRGFKLGNLPITTNEILTVSFDLKMVIGTAVNGYPYLLVYNTNYKGPHGQWIYVSNNSTNKMIPSGNYAVGDIIKRRASVTITTPSSFTAGSQTEDWIEFYSNYSTENEITITNIKVERGNKATPWVPAKADDVGNILGFNDTIEYDCSGYGNNGEIIGDLTYTSDTSRYTVATHITNGANTRISTPILSFPNNSLTLNIWFRSTNTSPTGNYHMVIDSVANRQWYEMCINNTGYLRAGLFINGTRHADNCTSKTALDGNWHMLTMTYDGTVIKRYFDGIMENSTKVTATSGLSSPTAIMLGRDGPNASYACIDADLSDFRIYATALSADDVRALYENSAYIDNSGNTYAATYTEV